MWPSNIYSVLYLPSEQPVVFDVCFAVSQETSGRRPRMGRSHNVWSFSQKTLLSSAGTETFAATAGGSASSLHGENKVIVW